MLGRISPVTQVQYTGTVSNANAYRNPYIPPVNTNAISVDAASLAATVGYATTQRWTVVIPAEAWAGGIGAALLIGALAGLLPALRAARMSPIQALWSV